MPKQKPVPVEDLIIPPQDQKICGTICLCQMTAVLSSVALVYLTVAIYVPSLRAFQSGINETPVMCTTIEAATREACEWGSCGEWCLSKTSGACVQIYVSLRYNGSTIELINCTNTANKTCYGIDQENAKKSRCIADECKNLTGTFNCTDGTCINITDAFECIFNEVDPPLKCSGRRGKITCIDLNGLYSCNRGTCERIRSPYNCDRRCVDIPTRNKNIIILSGDKVYLSQCEQAIDATTREVLWNETQNTIMMASCYEIENKSHVVEARDCINGSLYVPPEKINPDDKTGLGDKTNFTYLSQLFVSMEIEKRIAPAELDLLISNKSRLLINLEGCVNTLQDECKEFLREYGRDGTDHNAKARFPCFYASSDIEQVVARFDLDKTYKQFLVGFCLPSVLFVVSCFILILCQRTVVIGDDAKMRFQGCTGRTPPGEKSISSNNLADGGGGDSIMAL